MNNMANLQFLQNGKLWYLCVCYAFAWIVVKDSCACSLPTNSTIRELQPSIVKVRPGQNAIFSCEIADYNPSTRVSWITIPDVFRKQISLPHQDSRNATSTIMIKNVNTETTQQTIQCRIRARDSNGYSRICFSKVAYLIVHQFPNADKLNCNSSSSAILREGQNMSISCQVPKGNPPVNLTWETDITNISLSGIKDSEGMRILKEHLLISHIFHGKRFSCFVKSHAFPGQNLSCVIGPFNVYYKPKLTINPKDLHVLLDGQEVILISCTIDSYPPIDDVTWDCIPENIFERCNSTTNQIELPMPQDKEGFGNSTSVSVTCSACSSEGCSNMSSIITFIKPEHSPARQNLVSAPVLNISRDKNAGVQNVSFLENNFVIIITGAAVAGVLMTAFLFTICVRFFYRLMHRYDGQLESFTEQEQKEIKGEQKQHSVRLL